MSFITWFPAPFSGRPAFSFFFFLSLMYLFVVLHLHFQVHLQLTFDFTDAIPEEPGDTSIFLLGNVFLLPPAVLLLFFVSSLSEIQPISCHTIIPKPLIPVYPAYYRKVSH